MSDSSHEAQSEREVADEADEKLDRRESLKKIVMTSAYAAPIATVLLVGSKRSKAQDDGSDSGGDSDSGESGTTGDTGDTDSTGAT